MALTIQGRLKDLRLSDGLQRQPVEQLLMVFFKQTKLRYNKLAEEEKQWLAQDCKKIRIGENLCAAEG